MAVRKIDLMHKLFGLSENEDDTCGKCKNLDDVGSYYKCKHYGHSFSEATDFRLKYRACGLFNKDYDGRKVKELVKPDRRIKEDVEIEGQISLFDYLKGEQ